MRPQRIPPHSRDRTTASGCWHVTTGHGLRLGSIHCGHRESFAEASTNERLFAAWEQDLGKALCDALLDYLPSTGPAAPLNAILVDPFTTISGIFGGQVAGLRLNIDFSDAGILSQPSGVSFGDLLLTGLTGDIAGLDGLSPRQFQRIANDFLGGALEPYPIADFSAVLMLINGAFEGGFHNAWADAHLELPAVTVVPEPSTSVLLALGSRCSAPCSGVRDPPAPDRAIGGRPQSGPRSLAGIAGRPATCWRNCHLSH